MVITHTQDDILCTLLQQNMSYLRTNFGILGKESDKICKKAF